MRTKLLTIAFLLFTLTGIAQVTNNLISSYSFNNHDASDDKGLHNGNVHGATLTTDRFGNDSMAYHFTRDSSQYIEVPHTPDFTPNNNPLSVSLWFLSESNDTIGGKIIDWYRCGANPSCNNIDNGWYTMGITDSLKLNYQARSGVDSSFTTPQKVNDNTWHHAVLVLDPTANALLYYLDNALLDSSVANIGSIPDGGVNIPFEIGRHYITGWGVPESYYQGKIDDIRIYNKHLSSTEVDSLFRDPDPRPISTGVTELKNKISLSIFPNPATDNITIDVAGTNYPDNIEVINMLGIVVTSFGKTSHVKFSTSGMPAGLYFIKARTGNGNVVVSRFIVM